MILSNTALLERGPQLLAPFDPKRVQSASIDVLLGSEVLLPSIKPNVGGHYHQREIDLADDQAHNWVPATIPDEGLLIGPAGILLGCTVELVTMPADLCADIAGKSSLGRNFLTIHQTAGFIDPGFVGHVTLELKNEHAVPLRIYAGMPVAQLRFLQLDQPATALYGDAGLGSKYQGQRGPQVSKYHLNLLKESA